MDHLARLMAKKEQIEQVIKAKQEDLAVPLTESVNELALYDQHPADIGTELYEREKDSGLLELLELEMEKVNDAINQYNLGRYGICERCSQPIEEARLERLVNTTLCSSCARHAQDKFTRPAEEGVLNPGDMSDRGEAFQVAGYEFYEE
ncbi:MAG: TraR/DksA C4-type zinc finger protein [Syntrophomonadaceae bacterium]|jgi:DnaK suppressor protein